MKRCAFFLLSLLCAANPAIADDAAGNERFGKLAILNSTEKPIHVVLFFSGKSGMGDNASKLAGILAQNNVLVVAIDTKSYLEALESDDDDCAFLAGEIERLSQSVHHSKKLIRYHQPILVGYQEGAAVAYAVMAQNPRVFKGLLTLGSFCPQIDLPKLLCPGDGLRSKLQQGQVPAQIFSGSSLSFPWILLQNQNKELCPAALLMPVVKQNSEAQLVQLPDMQNDLWQAQGLADQINASLAKLDQPAGTASATDQEDVADLPLTELESTTDSSDSFVVFLSGDGGWATIDREIGEYLAAHDLPVIGFDSLKYFWKKRSPEESAQALARVVKYYRSHWGKTSAILAGFSMGADVLPGMLSKLSPDAAAAVRAVVLLSPGLYTDYEVHISEWIGLGSDTGEIAIFPELQRFKEVKKLLCVYGEEEQSESLCPKLEGTGARIVALSGSHHFDGDYEPVAKLILNEATAK
jgi:type IV secretory pathway VirJ component